MERKKPEKVRDITMASLLFVISLFPAVFAWRLSNQPDILTFSMIYMCVVVSNIIASVAKHLFFGVSMSDE